jgi:hypothetical protein
LGAVDAGIDTCGQPRLVNPADIGGVGVGHFKDRGHKSSLVVSGMAPGQLSVGGNRLCLVVAVSLLAVSQGDLEAGRSLLDDVSRRFVHLDKAAMGTTYALGMADVFRRAGRPVLAAELLRHALSLLGETKSPEKYAKVREQLAVVEDALLEEQAHGHQ